MSTEPNTPGTASANDLQGVQEIAGSTFSSPEGQDSGGDAKTQQSASQEQPAKSWQEEAWERERALVRTKLDTPRPAVESANSILAPLYERLAAMAVTENSSSPATCDPHPWRPGSPDEQTVYCDGHSHYINRAVLRRCPKLIANEVRQRVAKEKVKLAGVLLRLGISGEDGFAGFDQRNESCAIALRVMQEFSSQRPPLKNVYLYGRPGLGKTRLLVASHFTLLSAGISSHYVTTPDLRRAFKAALNFEPEIAEEGKEFIERLTLTQVVHFDDAGDIEGDQRSRGMFAEGVKELLDRSRATWAVGSNLQGQEAGEHPDLSQKIISRFLQGATIVQLKGSDYRLATAKVY